ncbi:MAG: ATP synthase F1 subunit epsilon [Alphaproteobacteria bacterium]|nr:ATP synthase F1 subunit epsilon [Alphaproteobacteria bacterium SS10]
MAEEKIRLELVSPEKLLLTEEVGMVILPGSDGQFGVLAKHIPLVSTLDPGAIDVYQDGKVDQRIFVSGGFVEVDGERCIVLAEDAMPLDSLEADDVRQECRNLKEDLDGADGEAATILARRKLDVAEAKLAAVTGESVATY